MSLQPEPITTARLVLEPLRVEHAEEMAVLLDDVRLHEFTGGEPLAVDLLRDRYARQVAGVGRGWLNWVVRYGGLVVGTVQATLEGGDAEVAWVVGVAHQGRGFAGEAAVGMAGWLLAHGVRGLVAHVHPEHLASAAVARRVGLVASDVVVDGEVRWVSAGR
ncbi:GNAT family N-acetyltransferase [Umezawaea endophytica]|uniref:GNAT family N-acetyltransferase n=1 Tax=Umezawaea endophytica TaxID=1654476 RepID=A0A9X2VLQ0_9PSEU|nr:GNAT family N-acetyltransferase [Umezawaea endophytica]MCS7478895.1 GNAT family N-acetyltransferase [Umezawaea endophytica]